MRYNIHKHGDWKNALAAANESNPKKISYKISSASGELTICSIHRLNDSFTITQRSGPAYTGATSEEALTKWLEHTSCFSWKVLEIGTFVT